MIQILPLLITSMIIPQIDVYGVDTVACNCEYVVGSKKHHCKLMAGPKNRTPRGSKAWKSPNGDRARHARDRAIIKDSFCRLAGYV